MVGPAVIALVRLGSIIYKIGTSPAAQAMGKRLVDKLGGKLVQSTSKKTVNLTASRLGAIETAKTPGIASKIGGALRGTKVTKATPGAEKGSVVVGAVRTASKKLGDKVIGGTVVGVPSVAVIAKMRSDLKKAKTETEREKLRADISDAVGKVQDEKAKAKDKGDTKSRTENTNTRRGNNEKVPQGTRVPTSKPGVKKSPRPKLRPKNLKDGGMPMVMKDGKSVPAYAADGVGKMNKGGMTMKKPAKKMMAGGMAKKKPAAKKMMAGGMAKKKMMGGGMAKSTGYMYGGMAKKTKAKK